MDHMPAIKDKISGVSEKQREQINKELEKLQKQREAIEKEAEKVRIEREKLQREKIEAEKKKEREEREALVKELERLEAEKKMEEAQRVKVELDYRDVMKESLEEDWAERAKGVKEAWSKRSAEQVAWNNKMNDEYKDMLASHKEMKEKIDEQESQLHKELVALNQKEGVNSQPRMHPPEDLGKTPISATINKDSGQTQVPTKKRPPAATKTVKEKKKILRPELADAIQEGLSAPVSYIYNLGNVKKIADGKEDSGSSDSGATEKQTTDPDMKSKPTTGKTSAKPVLQAGPKKPTSCDLESSKDEFLFGTMKETHDTEEDVASSPLPTKLQAEDLGKGPISVTRKEDSAQIMLPPADVKTGKEAKKLLTPKITDFIQEGLASTVAKVCNMGNDKLIADDGEQMDIGSSEETDKQTTDPVMKSKPSTGKTSTKPVLQPAPKQPSSCNFESSKDEFLFGTMKESHEPDEEGDVANAPLPTKLQAPSDESNPRTDLKRNVPEASTREGEKKMTKLSRSKQNKPTAKDKETLQPSEQKPKTVSELINELETSAGSEGDEKDTTIEFMKDYMLQLGRRIKAKERYAKPVITAPKVTGSSYPNILEEAERKGLLVRDGMKIKAYTGEIYVRHMPPGFQRGKTTWPHIDVDRVWHNDGTRHYEDPLTRTVHYFKEGPSRKGAVENGFRKQGQLIEKDGVEYMLEYYTKARKKDEEREPSPPPAQYALTMKVATPAEPIAGKLDRITAKIHMEKAKEDGILQDVLQYMIPRPKGNDLYYFDVRHADDWFDNVTADLHHWRSYDIQNNPGSTIEHWRYKVLDHNKKKTDAFVKEIFHHKKEKVAMVRFIGDEKVAGIYPHGNSVTNTRPHIRTSAAVKAHVREAASVKPGPIVHELARKGGPGEAAAVSVPTNTNQVKYLLNKERAKESLGVNDLASVVHVAEVFKTYCRQIIATPDHNLYLLVNPDTLREYQRMLDHIPEGTKVVHQLDTSFDFNGKYLTCLSFRHELLAQEDTINNLNTKPTIPLMTYIHQRRSNDDHESAFYWGRRAIERQVPDFATSPKILITDREFKGNDYLPNASHVYCWNHIITNLDFKASTDPRIAEGARPDIIADMYAMLRSESVEQYEQRREESFAKPIWTENLKAYYMRRMNTDVIERTGAWYLADIGYEEPQNGATTNAAESLNHILGQHKADPRKSSGELIIDLKVMEDDYAMDCERAFFSQGKYVVRKEYQKLVQPTTNMPQYQLKSTREYIQEIAQKVREEEAFQRVAEREMEGQGTSLSQAAEIPEESRLARDIVENGTVAVVELKGHGKFYNVAARDGEIHRVSLEENTCTCNRQNFCGHYIAVAHTVGLTSNYQPPKGMKPPKRGAKMEPKFRHGGKRPHKKDTVSEVLEGKLTKRAKRIEGKSGPSQDQLTPNPDSQKQTQEPKKPSNSQRDKAKEAVLEPVKKLNSDGDTDVDHEMFSVHSEDSGKDICDDPDTNVTIMADSKGSIPSFIEGIEEAKKSTPIHSESRTKDPSTVELHHEPQNANLPGTPNQVQRSKENIDKKTTKQQQEQSSEQGNKDDNDDIQG